MNIIVNSNISWKHHFNRYMIIILCGYTIIFFPIVGHWCCFYFSLLNRGMLAMPFILVYRSVSLSLLGRFLEGCCLIKGCVHFLEALDMYCWTAKHVHKLYVNVAQSDWLPHVTLINFICKGSISFSALMRN